MLNGFEFKFKRMSFLVLPMSFFVGISYDKPHLYIALGLVYIEITFPITTKKKKKDDEKFISSAYRY